MVSSTGCGLRRYEANVTTAGSSSARTANARTLLLDESRCSALSGRATRSSQKVTGNYLEDSAKSDRRASGRHATDAQHKTGAGGLQPPNSPVTAGGGAQWPTPPSPRHHPRHARRLPRDRRAAGTERAAARRARAASHDHARRKRGRAARRHGRAGGVRRGRPAALRRGGRRAARPGARADPHRRGAGPRQAARRPDRLSPHRDRSGILSQARVSADRPLGSGAGGARVPGVHHRMPGECGGDGAVAQVTDFARLARSDWLSLADAFYRHLDATFAHLSPAAWERPTPYLGWRARDVLAHMTSAMPVNFRQVLDRALADNPAAPPEFDTFTRNAREVRRRRATPIRTLLDEFHRELDALMATYRRMSDAEWEKPAWFFVGRVRVRTLFLVQFADNVFHERDLLASHGAC